MGTIDWLMESPYKYFYEKSVKPYNYKILIEDEKVEEITKLKIHRE